MKDLIMKIWNMKARRFSLEQCAEVVKNNNVLISPVKINDELWDIWRNRPRKWKVVYLGFNGQEWHINIVHYDKNNQFHSSKSICESTINTYFFRSLEDCEKAIGDKK